MIGRGPAVAVLFAIAATYGCYQLGRALFHPKQGLDLAPAYLAARLVLDGSSATSFYDDPALSAVGARHGVHGPGGPGDPVLNFVYPPWVPVVYLPVALLPWEVARRVFFLVSLLAIALALRQVSRVLALDAIPFVVGAFFFPIAYELMTGQANGLLLLTLTSALTLLVKDRPFSAGLVLALAAFWKPFLLLAALFLVFRREGRALGGLLAGAAVLVATGFLVGGPDAWMRWWIQVSAHNALEFAEWRNHGIDSAVLALFAKGEVTSPLLEAPGIVRPLQLALKILALGLGLIALARTTTRPATRYALQLFSTLAVALLVTPKSWEHYGVFLLPAFLAAYAVGVAFEEGRIALSVLGASFAVWAFAFQLKEEYAAVSHAPLVLLLPLKTYATFALLAVSAWVLNRGGRAGTIP